MPGRSIVGTDSNSAGAYITIINMKISKETKRGEGVHHDNRRHVYNIVIDLPIAE